ncbi:hypothetical protein CsSME_00031293 [Camellia sinensis var. sinensis]
MVDCKPHLYLLSLVCLTILMFLFTILLCIEV